jgi:hypothetical protein
VPGYGYGASVSSSRTAIVASSGGAAPSELLIATTPNISVVVPGVTTFSMTQQGGSLNPYWQTSFDENNWSLRGFAGVWQLIDGDGSEYATNPSSSLTIIPQSNWTPSITITAA